MGALGAGSVSLKGPSVQQMSSRSNACGLSEGHGNGPDAHGQTGGKGGVVRVRSGILQSHSPRCHRTQPGFEAIP